MRKIDKSKVDESILLTETKHQLELIKIVATIYEKKFSANFSASFLMTLGAELIIEACSNSQSFEHAQQDYLLVLKTIEKGIEFIHKDEKVKINNEKIDQVIKDSGFTKKENEDVIFALEIIEKNKAELEFAGNVLRELKTKTMFLNMSKKYEMKYPNFEECKKLQKSKTENFEITKH